MAGFNIPDEPLSVVATGKFETDIADIIIHEQTEQAIMVVLVGYDSGSGFVQIGNRTKQRIYMNRPADPTTEPPTAEVTDYSDFRTAMAGGWQTFKAFLQADWGNFQ